VCCGACRAQGGGSHLHGVALQLADGGPALPWHDVAGWWDPHCPMKSERIRKKK
jgi:hypothetical protein